MRMLGNSAHRIKTKNALALWEITNMRRRSGFTLVEVLVSMALILFIMSILAGAFGAASQAVSDLKAAGDLAEKLRGATNVIKRDMEAYHFTDDGTNTIRLSDSNFWNRLTLPPPPSPVGFFSIYQGLPVQPAYAGPNQPYNEGSDLDNIPSFFQTTTSLHYTIALRGTRRSDFLSAAVLTAPPSALLQASPVGPYTNYDTFYQDTPGVFSSQYAEVELFLGPTGDSTDGSTGVGAQPLFALYRRQQLAVPQSWTTQTPISPAEFATDVEMSMSPVAPGILNFNTMQDLSMPIKRFGSPNLAGVLPPPPNPPTPPYQPMAGQFAAADLLMTDVLSFDVRLLVQAGPAPGTLKGAEFEDLFQLTDPNRKVPGTNTTWFFSPNNNSTLAAAGIRAFDTWTNLGSYSTWQTAGTPVSIPMFNDNFGNPISVKALQITLRVWDFKTKKTRQVTIVQQM
jgi:prepilin-type N-terminal cleavage/methylation domain-containing protein